MKSDREMADQMGDMIEKHVAELAQHFDNVLIIANSHNGEKRSTQLWEKYRGNFFALKGHAQQWVDIDPIPAEIEEDDE